jgi:hypothetical protein
MRGNAMRRSQILLVLLALMAAVPTALAGRWYLSASEAACFSAGATGYRLTGSSTADYTIRIDNAAAQPDLALQLVDDPGVADFVLADGGENPSTCTDVRAIRTIRIDPMAREADLIIALNTLEGSGRYKIYAHSADLTAQQAAALYAVIWNAGRKRVAAVAP